MQENLNQFIGIPYLFNGDTKDGCDCSGLVMLVYRHFGWKPDYYEKPTEKDWYEHDIFKMERFLLKHFIKERNYNKLSFGDIVLMKINDETHAGIYLNYHKILTTFPPNIKLLNGSIMPDKSMIMRENIWLPAYRCGFKRKGWATVKEKLIKA